MTKNKLLNNDKKNVLFVSFVLAILLVSFLYFGLKMFRLDNEIKYSKYKNLEEINISLSRIEKIFEENIKNRCIKNNESKILIGENQKQIENGYYDLKVNIENNECIVIALNKLWKQFDEKLYQEEYVAEIAESIENILELDGVRDKIYEYIFSGYSIAKNSENDKELKKEYILDLDSFELNGQILYKEFLISIYRK